MKRNKTQDSTFKFQFAVTIIILCVSCDLWAGRMPDIARITPAETVALVQIENFQQFKQQVEKTSFYKLYKDPVMAVFIEKFKAKLKERTKETQNDIISTVINENILPQGRTAFALVMDQKALDANEPTALLIIEWGKNIDKIKEVINKATKKALEDEYDQKSEDYRGLNIKTIIAPETKRLSHGFSSKFSYCFIDDSLVASEDIEVLKFAIAHIKGATGPTLQISSDYTATTKALGPYNDINIYINIKQILKTIVAEDSSGSSQRYISNLGVENITSAAATVGIARQAGTSCYGKALLKIDGPKKGLCRMFDTEASVPRPPRFIPSSTYSVMFFNLNFRNVYNELANILNSFSPQLAAIMYMPIVPPSPDGEPGIFIKNDIIDHLGSQIIVSQTINKPFTKDKASSNSLIALAVENRNALEKSMSALHNRMLAPNNPDSKRELLGHTIYLINVSSLLPMLPTSRTPMQNPNQPAVAPAMPKMAFTVTDTHLIFGTEDMIETALRTLDTTGTARLDSAQWFKDSKAAITPPAVGLASLKDSAASAELLWWMLKNHSREMLGASNIFFSTASGTFRPSDLVDLVDFTLLPEFATVEKYFGLFTFTGLSRDDGFYFEVKDLPPR